MNIQVRITPKSNPTFSVNIPIHYNVQDSKVEYESLPSHAAHALTQQVRGVLREEHEKRSSIAALVTALLEQNYSNTTSV